MAPRHYIIAGSVIAIMLGAGCSHGSSPFRSSGLHETSRTGKVVDVNIVGNEVTPKKVTVRPGDEVRWVNQRTGPVEIAFTNPIDERTLACDRNFGVDYRSKIGATDSASLCFAGPGTLTYVVRMEAPVPGNEIVDSGTIEVTDKGSTVSRR